MYAKLRNSISASHLSPHENTVEALNEQKRCCTDVKCTSHGHASQVTFRMIHPISMYQLILLFLPLYQPILYLTHDRLDLAKIIHSDTLELL